MKAYVYVFDTLADWEIGFITAELNTGRFFHRKGVSAPVITVGMDLRPVRTMGGLAVKPEIKITDIVPETGDVLILPGGDSWMNPGHGPVIDAVEDCLGNGVVVGAICGATLALAERGLLNSRRHTSNDPEFLKAFCPHYAGESFYVSAPAVADDTLITASGTAPLEFAYEILKRAEVFSEETLDAWFNLYRSGRPEYYHALMKSVEMDGG
jgi:putative intracellular protease/amidase